MPRILPLLICFSLTFTLANAQGWAKQGKKFQAKLDKFYQDTATSPLPHEDVADFAGHPFYAPNKKFIVKADFELTPDTKPFQMPTSTDRLPIYRQFGIATFDIEGKSYQLAIFQNQKHKETLFLPFYDSTNSETTYGGGRYIDIGYPRGKKIKIDFNKAYHPYCAYSDRYSCPIPPAENSMDIEVEAGVQLAEKYMH
jgi:uncharacterized protein (DUF1684 family)